MEQQLLPPVQSAVQQMEQVIAQLDREIDQLTEERKKKKALKADYERFIRIMKGEKKQYKSRLPKPNSEQAKEAA